MHVKVRLLAYKSKHLSSGEREDGWARVELEEGTRVSDLVKRVGLPEQLSKLIILDENIVDLNQHLSDDQAATIMPPLLGR